MKTSIAFHWNSKGLVSALTSDGDPANSAKMNHPCTTAANKYNNQETTFDTVIRMLFMILKACPAA